MTAKLTAALGGLALIVILAAAPHGHAAEPTGQALPGLDAFDQAMAGLLDKWQIPGASLAVARHGRIVLARGYGLADKARGDKVQPDSLFRIGSLSKMLTAVAVLRLAEDGKLGLDDKVLPILGDAGPRPERIADVRVRDITIRHLLQHTGGFDRAASGDPMFGKNAVAAAERQGGTMPPRCDTVLRDALERKLDFAPGRKYAYSNVGYCILGRAIEIVAATGYDSFVQSRLLVPSGVTAMRLGRTLQRAPSEVAYHDAPGAKPVTPMAGLGIGNRVPAPYGGFAIESLDAVGRWTAAPVDYLRFLLAIDGTRGRALLAPGSVREMLARPRTPGRQDAAVYYGLGVNVRLMAGGETWSHAGSLPGSEAYAIRTGDGTAWVVAFNMRPANRGEFRAEMHGVLAAAAASIARWPDGDLVAGDR